MEHKFQILFVTENQPFSSSFLNFEERIKIRLINENCKIDRIRIDFILWVTISLF